MRRLSASKVALAVHCTHFLRDDAPPWDKTTGYAARLGHAAHEFAQFGGTHSVAECAKNNNLSPAQVRDLGLIADQWLRTFAPRVHALASREVKFAWDPETGEARELKTEGKRNYADAPDGWITGEADLVQWEDGHTLYIADYKTGFWVENSDESMQLLTLSVMASKAFKVDVVRATNVKMRPDICYELPVVERDRFLLDVAEDELKRIHLTVTPDAPAVAGEWCKAKWCPSRGGCGAYQAWEAGR